jgi:transcriptional regulator with XRE-family HTH domain
MTPKKGRPFVLPLGYQYGQQRGEVDPVWQVLRAARIAQGLSIQALAEMSGVASSTISRAERGYHAWLDKTRLVARALHVTIVAIGQVPPRDPEETSIESHSNRVEAMERISDERGEAAPVPGLAADDGGVHQ